jgi:hypothetical protein
MLELTVWVTKAFKPNKSSFSSPLSETITRLNGSFRRIVCTAKRDVRLICLVWNWMCSALIVLWRRCLEALMSLAVPATDSSAKQPATGIWLLIYIIFVEAAVVLIVTSVPSSTFHEIVLNAGIDFISYKGVKTILGYAPYRLASGRTDWARNYFVQRMAENKLYM